MVFLSVAHTDVGIKKHTNQDSVLIKEATTDCGKVLLAVVCDGMGGLAKGEVASATLVRAFSDWFEDEFPYLIYDKEGNVKEPDYNELQKSWNQLIDVVNRKIAAYGQSCQAACGTTLAGLLLIKNHYYIVNVGDSRVYHFSDTIHVLTKDQTFVQREMDEGRMTPEQAKVHPQRNVLLQCVGASTIVIPDFFEGTFEKENIFMICSDGFRHLITEEEFCKIIDAKKLVTEVEMREAAVYCTELNKQRRENDNISVVLIKAG